MEAQCLWGGGIRSGNLYFLLRFEGAFRLVAAHWCFLAVLNTGLKTSGSSLKPITHVEITETDFPKGYSN